MATKKRTCIVGIGNQLRSDDGLGPYVCQLLEENFLPGVHFMVTQQLDIGIAEELSKYDAVIFADASLKLEKFSFKPLILGNQVPIQTFSHQINAMMLANLIRQLYASKTQFFICAIGAANFEMGNQVSQTARQNALDAVVHLSEWVQRNQ